MKKKNQIPASQEVAEELTESKVQGPRSNPESVRGKGKRGAVLKRALDAAGAKRIEALKRVSKGYIVIHGEDLEKFQQDVNEHVTAGWWPQGGLVVFHSLHHAPQYLQAMVWK